MAKMTAMLWNRVARRTLRSLLLVVSLAAGLVAVVTVEGVESAPDAGPVERTF